ncbi:MAG: diguanylate cyclase [Candidatus Omnitrophica bacterium]|nr:diguanylate cyclase [Candidatus Omnitrophota bacterium]
MENRSDEKLNDEIKFLQIRITELEKSESRYKFSEELLQKTELQQKAILNGIPDIAWLKDKESNFIIVNEAFGESCGVKPDDLIGKTDLDIWPKDLAEHYRKDDLEVITTGKRKIVEERLADKKNKTLWIETIKTPIFNKNGEVIGTTGIARDISERKRYEDRLREARAELEIRVKVRTAELAKANDDLRREISEHEKSDEALRISEEKHRIIYQNVPICIWEEDYTQLMQLLNKLELKNGVKDLHAYIEKNPDFLLKASRLIQITDINSTTLHVYEANDKQELLQSLDKIFVPASYEVFKQEIIAIIEGKKYFESECVNRSLKGKLLHMYLRMSIPSNMEEAKRVIVTMGDISKLKEAENKVIEMNQQFKHIFNDASDGMLIVDPVNQQLYLSNKAMQKMLGYKPSEIIKLKVKDIHPEEVIKETKNKLKAAALGSVINIEDFALKRKNNATIHASLTVSRVNINKRMYLLGTFKDITDKLKSAALIKLKEQKFKELFNSISSGVVVYEAIKRGSDFIIVDFNHGAELIDKVKKESLVGKRVTKVFPGVKRTGILNAFKKVWQTGSPISLPSFFYKDKKRKGWRESYIYRLPTGEVVEIYNDITQRKETELELLKSNKRLKELSLIDSHTGLYSYHYLGQAIEAEFQRAKRYAHPFSVLMLDIDYFKSINDVYGHEFGDLVLKQFAGQLKRIVRRYDVVIRFGGEEFLIISPGIDRDQGFVLGQRILSAMSLYNFGDRKSTIKLKISLSVVSYPEDSCTRGMSLINLADNILGKAKESGGNRVFTSLDINKSKSDETKKRGSFFVKVLQNRINKLNRKSREGLSEAIIAFAKTIEIKDHYTGEHVEHTVKYTTEISKRLGLTKDEIELVKQASILHDLGKIGVSEKVLLKKGKLTTPEYAEIKKHPQIAADILRPIQSLRRLIPLILYHHEKWDGSGYPSGIKGDDIPIGARIISVADVYQALTSNRPYRKALKKEKALKIIKAGSGTQFDPRVVDCFLAIIQKKK